MDVPFQTKFMALSWTAGELLCLIYLRWLLFSLLKKSQRKKVAFLTFCVISLVFIVWILYDGVNIFYRWLDAYAGLGWFYLHLLWKFFVTLWVGIEGVCLIYGFRIYNLVKSIFTRNKFSNDVYPISYRGWLTASFLFLIFTFYFFFFFNAIHVFQKYALTNDNLYNISSFYLRICGLLFNIIEWLIAILLFRGYVLLKKYYHAKVIL